MKKQEWRIEQHLVDECKRIGLLCLKVKAVGRRGFPDRSIFGPAGELFLVETKTVEGELSRQQKETIEQLRGLGFKVFVPKSAEEVNRALFEILQEIETTRVFAGYLAKGLV